MAAMNLIRMELWQAIWVRAMLYGNIKQFTPVNMQIAPKSHYTINIAPTIGKVRGVNLLGQGCKAAIRGLGFV